jgi:hypothetical protein
MDLAAYTGGQTAINWTPLYGIVQFSLDIQTVQIAATGVVSIQAFLPIVFLEQYEGTRIQVIFDGDPAAQIQVRLADNTLVGTIAGDSVGEIVLVDVPEVPSLGVWSVSSRGTAGFGAGLSTNRETLVVGGLDAGGVTQAQGYRYDGWLKVWRTVGALAVARSNGGSWALSQIVPKAGTTFWESHLVGGIDATLKPVVTHDRWIEDVRLGDTNCPVAAGQNSGAEGSLSEGYASAGTNNGSWFRCTAATGMVSTWLARAAPALLARAASGANRLGEFSSRILRTGGSSPATLSGQTTSEYNQSLDSWAAKASWPQTTPVAQPAACTWGDPDGFGGIVLAGGTYDVGGADFFSDQASRFTDAGAGGWVGLPFMPAGRGECGIAYQQGPTRAYVCGGRNVSGILDTVLSLGQELAWRTAETAMPMPLDAPTVVGYAPFLP